MSRDLSNGDDVIDSRDVIARLEELQDERNALVDDLNAAEGDAEAGVHATALAAWDEENGAELAALGKLNDEAEGYASDWHHGETLIRDSYFEDYAQQLAEDIGALENCNNWPATCIDWKRAARELQMDYTAVDFDGVTYWVR